jgi:hypothetical protein
MSELSMIQTARKKDKRILCSAPRCPEAFGEIAELTSRQGQCDNEGNTVDEWDEPDGLALMLKTHFDRRPRDGVFILSHRPANRRHTTHKMVDSMARIRIRGRRLNTDWYKARRDPLALVIRGLDDLKSYDDPGEDCLPITVCCPRCGRLSRITREVCD